MKIRIGILIIFIITFGIVLNGCVTAKSQSNQKGPKGGRSALDINGNETPGQSQTYTFDNAPVSIVRGTALAFKLPSGQTHWYEAVFLPEGGVNWVQAKVLAELVGGHLVTLHSKQENEFVFNLIKDKKFWFKWDSSHNYVMNGPFIGAFQPQGSREPSGGWKWVTGEEWTYSKWCKDGVRGDRDRRPNNQPNDSTGNQNVAAYGEVNDPVRYWGDFPHKFGTYNSPFPGAAYGFIIEYNTQP
jgi:hypothetical protein